jgi:DNA polymerase-3 subunit alpha
LHCHTDYSLLDGACEIGSSWTSVSEQKMPAVAMTDHGNLFGAVEFYNKAQGKRTPSDHRMRSLTSPSRTTPIKAIPIATTTWCCCAKRRRAIATWSKLVSTAYLDGFYYKPRIDKDLLARHSKGLIALSACLRGDVNETLLADRYEDARRLAYEYQDLFGKGNFFLEVQDHGLEQDRVVLPHLGRLAADTGIPLVATNDSHYLRKDDAHAHEVMLCIQTGKTMSDPNRMRFEQPAFYLKSREEMMTLFGDVEDALDRTWDIAQRCQVELKEVAEPFPKFGVPQGHSTDTFSNTSRVRDSRNAAPASKRCVLRAA